jgi:hypothetical protein
VWEVGFELEFGELELELGTWILVFVEDGGKGVAGCELELELKLKLELGKTEPHAGNVVAVA